MHDGTGEDMHTLLAGKLQGRQHFEDLRAHADKRVLLTHGLWRERERERGGGGLPTFTVPGIFCTHISYII